MLVLLGLVLVFILLLLYIRKENLDDKKTSEKKSDDKKDESADTKKTEQPTIIVVNSGTDAPYPRFADPFYTMTDPYWSAYNYRPYGFGHRVVPRPHRRIW